MRLNGIFLLDKPIGISSNAALQKVKRLFNAKKAGHTGSLDPLATGMLPICFGDATKFSQYLLDSDKTYLVTMQLGIRTNTSDAEGEVISTRDVPNFSFDDIDIAFNSFRGKINQIPSMFSALKHNGKPLYEYARQGIFIERPSRPITVYDLKLISIENNAVTFSVHCSKGTYIRTIVDDVGEQLNCGAHVTALRRLSVGPYFENQMMTIAQLELLIQASTDLRTLLLPMDTSVNHWPAVTVSPAIAFALKQGQSVMIAGAPTSGWMRFIESNGEFFGVGETLPDGKIAPRRLVAINN
ncbi:MAG: tRNA pseudouridine(55) synthase TruB [Gammaproteobacteria bacterium RIFCSPHIGHO2_12_FULL_38_11]|nr:MAG: tRNA pseudouridine(55) synthase TruB [Gammaproteobacteria bacterium RIFCSPHIGHO2_12_FULL_38_11]